MIEKQTIVRCNLCRTNFITQKTLVDDADAKAFSTIILYLGHIHSTQLREKAYPTREANEIHLCGACTYSFKEWLKLNTPFTENKEPDDA